MPADATTPARRGRARRGGDAALGGRCPTRSPAQATAAARILVARGERGAARRTARRGRRRGRARERPIGVVGAGAMQRLAGDAGGGGRRSGRDGPRADAAAAPGRGLSCAPSSAGDGVVRGPTSGLRRRGAADRAGDRRRGAGDARPRRARRGAGRRCRGAAARPAAGAVRAPAAASRSTGALVRRLALLARRDPGGDAGDRSLVRIAKYSFAADALEARADALARDRAAARRDGDRRRPAADRAAGAVRGPGLGFTATTAAVFAAVRATPGTEVTGARLPAQRRPAAVGRGRARGAGDRPASARSSAAGFDGARRRVPVGAAGGSRAR